MLAAAFVGEAAPAHDARLILRLLRYVQPHWRSLLAAFLAMTVGVSAALAQPYLIKIAIDRFIATRAIDRLDRLALGYLGILLVGFAAECVQIWTLQSTGQRIAADLREAICRQLHRLDVKYYDRHPVGWLMTRIIADVEVLNEFFATAVITMTGDVFTITGATAGMIWMSSRLALATGCILPLIAWVTWQFRRHVRHCHRLVRAQVAAISAFLQESIAGVATVQAFRRERLQSARFAAINGQHRGTQLRLTGYYAAFDPAVEAIGTLTVGLILWYGGGRVLQATLSLGTLVAFIQFTQRLFRPIADMADKFDILQSALAASEQIFAVLDEPVAAQSAPVATAAAPALAPHIVFDHVWFAYHGDDYVLRDVSFEIRPGQRVGVVGATGAGKTSVINLLLRFYEVQRGRILLDGVDVRDLDVGELRGFFGLVLQDVQLFSGSIADNIRLGRRSIDAAAVRRAAGAVHAAPFIERLPDGYDTALGEGGTTLSAGERQLLSFARALASDPRVLLLDEATSNVDTETECLIRDALRTLMAGRTTVAVAHRLSTIQEMDLILVFHKGRLRELGTSRELLARRGIYYKLFELQYRTPAERAGAGPGR